MSERDGEMVAFGVDVFDPARRVHELRLRGMGWREAAEQAGYGSAPAARAAVKAMLDRAAMEMDKEQRAERLDLELERLDALQAAFWTGAITGDDKAAATVLNVMRHRAKLLGLEVPDQADTRAKTIVVSGSTEEYQNALRAILAADEPADSGS